MAMHKAYSYKNKKGTMVHVKAHEEKHPVVFGRKAGVRKAKPKKKK